MPWSWLSYLFFYLSLAPPDLHSFPTRRSSDLFLVRLMPRTGPALGIAMLLTVIPGFIMYGRLSAGFNRAWVTSRPGLALGAGALAALLAAVPGVAANAPAGANRAALRTAFETQGGPPTTVQA